MEKKTGFILLVLFSLMLSTHSFATEWSGSFQQAPSLYAQARGYFEEGEEAYADSRTLFERIPLYQDSAKYICYMDSMLALVAEDLETAHAGFLMLQKENFLDSDTLFKYVCARHAEQVGNYYEALSLYSSLYAFDSRERLAALLKTVYGTSGPEAEMPPSRARKGAYAMVIANDADVFDAPDECEPFAKLPLAAYVRADSFAYDASGRLYAEITVDAKSPNALSALRESKKGVVRVHYLYFLTESERIDAGFPPTDSLVRGDVTWTGTAVKANAPIYDAVHKGKVIQTVNTGDPVTIVDQIFADKVFYQVSLPNSVDGFIETDCVAENPVPNVVIPTSAEGAFGLALSPIFPEPRATEETFDHALGLMLVGSAEAYQKAVLLFSRAESEYSAFYMLYAHVLLQIEKGDFDEARRALSAFEDTSYFQRRKANAELGILSNEPFEIPEPDILANYITAREYESQRLFDLAYAQYAELDGYSDALLRGAYAVKMCKEPIADSAADAPEEKDGFENAIHARPLSPLSVNLLSNDPADPDQKQMYAYRENAMKRTWDVSQSSLPVSSAGDAASILPGDIESLLIKRFVPALYDAFQDDSIFSPNAAFFEDIVLQKIISVDISPNMKRWNVCALLKMVEPQTAETVYLPVQMSDSGHLASSYFIEAAHSIDAFIKAHPLLLPEGV